MIIHFILHYVAGIRYALYTHTDLLLLLYILYLTLRYTLHITLLYCYMLHIHACFDTLPDTKIVKLLSQVVLKGVNERLPLTIVGF